MGGASKLESFLSLKDSNGIQVCQWAEKTDEKGIAKCKFCKCSINFKQVRQTL